MVAGLWALAAHAEAAWTGTRAAVTDAPVVGVFAGVQSVGASVALSDVSLEAAWLHEDRTLELRGARGWRSGRGIASFHLTAGATGILVPQDQLDLGLGGHVTATLGLGGRAFAVQLGGSSGVELFARGSARFVERVHLGAEARWGRLGLGVTGRAGVDFAPGRNFVVRADAVGFVTWRP